MSIRRSAGATLVAALLCWLFVAGAAQAADRIYLGRVGQISFVNVDGSGAGALSTGGLAVNIVEGAAIDPVAERFYWLNRVGNNDPTLRFANLDGSGGGQLNTSGALVREATGLAIDPVGRRIYWANRSAGRISFANLDGSGGGDLNLARAAQSFPSGVAINPTTRQIFWVNAAGRPGQEISFANLDGSGEGSLPITGAEVRGPKGVAVDPVGGRIYWANEVGDTISFANLDGSGGGMLDPRGAEVSSPNGVAIDPVAKRIYWANRTSELTLDARVSFVGLDGSGGGGNIDLEGDRGAAFPQLLMSPRATAPPAIAGGSSVGSALNCTQGTWGQDFVESFFHQAPHSFSFQWSRDGVEVPGATQSSLTATDPLGGDYRCRVTAANRSGTTASTSGPHRIAPIASGGVGSGSGSRGTGAKVTLSLLSPRITAKGPVAVRVGNSNSFAVTGKLTARSSAIVSPGGKRRITLGGGAFKVAADAKATVKLKLPNPLRLVLARQRKLPISLSATVTDPVASSHTVKKTVVPKLRT